MSRAILFVLTFIAFLYGQNVECKNETDKKCPYDFDLDSDNDYEYTVDLTGVKCNDDGSYTYRDTVIYPSGRDTVIPADLVRTYSSKKFKNGTEIQIREEIRGCICSIRKCLNICSHNLVTYFSNYSNKELIDEGYTKNMVLRNGVTSKVHLMCDFHLFEKSICKYEYPLSVEQNPNDNWTLYEDGNLLRHSGGVNLSMDEYCFDVYSFTEDRATYFLVNPFICGSENLPWNVLLNGIAMLVSVPFIVLTIWLYYIANKLSSYEKCLISYLSMLAISYALHGFLIVSEIQFPPKLCQGLGFAAYFSVICYLSWTCVTSYTIWNIVINGKTEASFKKYFIVGWSVPILMTLLTYDAERYVPDDDLKPGINGENCSVNTKRGSAFIYLYGPCFLVLIFSFFLYISVLCYIRQRNRSVQTNLEPKPDTKSFSLNFPVFLLMCFTWFCDIVSYFLQIFLGEEVKYYTIPDVLNASQGLFIFILFISKRRVWKLTRQRKKSGPQIVRQES